jgi:hypothetical protein
LNHFISQKKSQPGCSEIAPSKISNKDFRQAIDFPLSFAQGDFALANRSQIYFRK